MRISSVFGGTYFVSFCTCERTCERMGFVSSVFGLPMNVRISSDFGVPVNVWLSSAFGVPVNVWISSVFGVTVNVWVSSRQFLPYL